jgi:putative sigma-54 modulation protein
MNLSVTGHNLVVTPAIRSYINAKMDRVLRHYDHVIDARIVLSLDKLRQRAEVTLRVPGRDIFVECEQEDLYAAIDGMADKLDRQVVKHKTRVADHAHDALKHRIAEQ